MTFGLVFFPSMTTTVDQAMQPADHHWVPMDESPGPVSAVSPPNGSNGNAMNGDGGGAPHTPTRDRDHHHENGPPARIPGHKSGTIYREKQIKVLRKLLLFPPHANDPPKDLGSSIPLRITRRARFAVDPFTVHLSFFLSLWLLAHAVSFSILFRYVFCLLCCAFLGQQSLRWWPA